MELRSCPLRDSALRNSTRLQKYDSLYPGLFVFLTNHSPSRHFSNPLAPQFRYLRVAMTTSNQPNTKILTPTTSMTLIPKPHANGLSFLTSARSTTHSGTSKMISTSRLTNYQKLGCLGRSSTAPSWHLESRMAGLASSTLDGSTAGQKMWD